LCVVLASGAAGMFASAQAADLAATPVYTKANVVEEWNPWMIHVRGVAVFADGKSSLHVLGAPGVDSPNSGLSFGEIGTAELGVSYFFSPNLAAALILGVPHSAPIKGTGLLAGLPVGKSTGLAPSLTFQYHFTQFGAFQPYIGVGVNYTTFINTRAANELAFVPAGPIQTTRLSIGNSTGPVAQFGFDYMIDRHWGLNFDVKRIWLRPEYSATSHVISVGDLPVGGTAHIDPWVVGGGVTYKF